MIVQVMTMIQLSEILIADATAIFLMSIVSIQFKRNTHSPLIGDKIFLSLMYLTLVQSFLDILVFVLDGHTFFTARLLLYVGNIAYLIIDLLLAYVWVLYAEYKTHSDMWRLKLTARVLIVPPALQALVILSSPFTGFAFSIGPHNVYVRGTGLLISYIVVFAYLVYGAAIIYSSKRRHSENYMAMPAALFLIPVLVGVLVQALFYGISVTTLSVALGVTGIYLSMQNESSFLDALSGVYNRRYLDDYLNGISETPSTGKSAYGMLIDMDHFKEINDIYGHRAGDEAIIRLGNLLRIQVGNQGIVARYGGDEFLVIAMFRELADMEELAEKISRALDKANETSRLPYKLEFSYGCSRFAARAETAEDFVRRMDEKMYQMKQARKAARE